MPQIEIEVGGVTQVIELAPAEVDAGGNPNAAGMAAIEEVAALAESEQAAQAQQGSDFAAEAGPPVGPAPPEGPAQPEPTPVSRDLPPAATGIEEFGRNLVLRGPTALREGLQEGPFLLAGLPVDLANLPFALAGAGQLVPGGSKKMLELAREFGIISPETITPDEKSAPVRFMKTLGQSVTGGGLAGIASKAPGALTRQATETVGAALGQTAAEEFGNNPVLGLIGGMVGGAASRRFLHGPQPGAVRKYLATKGRQITGDTTNFAIKQRLGEWLRDSVPPERRQQFIQSIRDGLDKWGDHAPTLGMITNERDLVQLEAMLLKKPGPAQREISEAQQRLSVFAKESIEGVAEGAEQLYAKQFFETRVFEINKNMEDSIRKASEDAMAEINALGARNDPDVSARVAREHLLKAEEAGRREVSELYARIADDEYIVNDIFAFPRIFEQRLKTGKAYGSATQRRPGEKRLPEAVITAVNELKKVTRKPMKKGDELLARWSDIDPIRKALGRAIRKEAAEPDSDNQLIRRLDEMRDDIDLVLGTSPHAQGDSPNAQAISAARTAAFNQKERFLHGSIGKLIARAKVGGDKTQHELSIEKLFQGGLPGLSFARELRFADPKFPLKDSILDRFVGIAWNPDTEKFSVKKAERFLDNNRMLLDEVPGLAPALRRVAEKNENYLNLIKTAPGMLKADRELAVAQLFLNKSPDRAVAEALASPKNREANMQALFTQASEDPDALKGLRRATADRLLKDIQNDKQEYVDVGHKISKAKMRRWLDDKGDALRIVFDESEMDRLVDAGEAMMIRERIQTGNPGGGSDTIFGANVLNDFFARIGGLSLAEALGFKGLQKKAAFSKVARWINKVTRGGRIERLLSEFVTNPEMAVDMLQDMSKFDDIALERKVRGWLYSSGALSETLDPRGSDVPNLFDIETLNAEQQRFNEQQDVFNTPAGVGF